MLWVGVVWLGCIPARDEQYERCRIVGCKFPYFLEKKKTLLITVKKRLFMKRKYAVLNGLFIFKIN